MAEVTDIVMYRDGGTIEFRVSGSEADGFYRLQTPRGGVPEPLFKDRTKLAFGSAEEVAVLGVLREWLGAASTEDVLNALAELDRMSIWQNLPAHLANVVPLHRVRHVMRRLEDRLQSTPRRRT